MPYICNSSIIKIPTPQDLIIGNTSLSEAQYPTYYYYDYGVTAFIYTASELGGTAKTIQKIAFNMFNSSSSTRNANNQLLKLYHCNENEFPTNLRNNMTSSTSTTWNITNETTVKSNFSWTVTSVDQYYEIVFDTPFNYNGSDNLLIWWYNGDGSYILGTSSNPTSYGNSTGSLFQSYNDFQDTTPPSLTDFGTRDSTFKPQIKITYI